MKYKCWCFESYHFMQDKNLMIFKTKIWDWTAFCNLCWSLESVVCQQVPLRHNPKRQRLASIMTGLKEVIWQSRRNGLLNNSFFYWRHYTLSKKIIIAKINFSWPEGQPWIRLQEECWTRWCQTNYLHIA